MHNYNGNISAFIRFWRKNSYRVCSEFINLQSPKKNYCLRQLKVILKVMFINHNIIDYMFKSRLDLCLAL